MFAHLVLFNEKKSTDYAQCNKPSSCNKGRGYVPCSSILLANSSHPVAQPDDICVPFPLQPVTPSPRLDIHTHLPRRYTVWTSRNLNQYSINQRPERRPSGRKAAYAHPDVGSFELLRSRELNTAWASVLSKVVCSKGRWHSVVWGLNELLAVLCLSSGCCITFVEIWPRTWDQSLVQIIFLWRILHVFSTLSFLDFEPLVILQIFASVVPGFKCDWEFSSFNSSRLCRYRSSTSN